MSPVLIAGNDGPISAALAAGLKLLGWPVRVTAASGPAPADVSSSPGRPHVVLVHEDDSGAAQDWPFLPRSPGQRLVTVGGLAALETMGHAVERGASVALNADQSVRALVESVDEALAAAGAEGKEDRAGLAARLRERARQAGLFATLTARECDVLGSVLLGRGAAEIAGEQYVSIPTVRSHLQHTLAKLEVSSQVAAVALVARACRDPRVRQWSRLLHQF